MNMKIQRETNNLYKEQKKGNHELAPYATGNIEATPAFNSSPSGFICRAGLIVSKPMKQSKGSLVPHTLIDSSLPHLFTRKRSPFPVT